MSRIRYQIYLLGIWIENNCQVFCIHKSGAILVLMCLKWLKLIIILNSGIRQYLIMHKTIFPQNTTSVRYFNATNLWESDEWEWYFCVFVLMIYIYIYIVKLVIFIVSFFFNNIIFQEVSKHILTNSGW